MTEPDAPRKVIFVGGAPRSGTSVTHALLCTPARCNAYHPEISFVRPIFECHAVGMEHWQGHTSHFFQIPDHLTLHVRKLAHQSMFYVWRVLRRPQVMCVKDPLLTRSFASVKAVMDWPCQFVTVLRHPHHVIRSQQEVYTRSGEVMTPEDVHLLAVQYMESYAHIDDPIMEGALFHFRYEDLGQDWLVEQLRTFTAMPDIDPAAVWKKVDYTVTDAEKADPFYSPKYHSPINTENRLDPLPQNFQTIINTICKPIMQRCGYNENGDTEKW